MALVGVRTSVGGLYFDAVLKVDHKSSLTATDHPIEKGANVTDHAYIEPDDVSIEIGVSDSAVSSGSFGVGARSVNAFKAIKDLQQSLEPITIVSRLCTYKNMLITSISAPDDYTTTNALKATIMFHEVMVVTTDTVTISPRASEEPQKTASTNTGTVQAQTQASAQAKNQSILKQAASQLGL